ncbi:hypothetical protein [Paenibacillus sp. MER TA 81-3]|uniref:hypothetical protein n=1 Tax=Paenibacillus sp. MER TA 81-3 TaxID=2939573 RepID=UPI00203B5E6E|nr:hypothetical protein [Paenibacillus sp. MER TA 81-3]
MIRETISREQREAEKSQVRWSIFEQERYQGVNQGKRQRHQDQLPSGVAEEEVQHHLPALIVG